MALQKPAGTWTYEDLFDLPDDRRYEIIDGELYELPAPNFNHATIITNLMWALMPLIRALGGRIVVAPVDVFIPGGNPVEPDVMIVLPDNLEAIRMRGIEGAPNLVVEVLSPSNPEHDLIRKRHLYARAAIPEYWIVNPEATSVEVLRFVDGGYQTHCRATDDQPVTSAVLPELVLQASEVFDALVSEPD